MTGHANIRAIVVNVLRTFRGGRVFHVVTQYAMTALGETDLL